MYLLFTPLCVLLAFSAAHAQRVSLDSLKQLQKEAQLEAQQAQKQQSFEAQPLPAYEILDKSKVAEIPFQQVNNLIVVSIKLDNLIPLNFLVDTGVRTAILTERFYSDFLDFDYARKLSLKGAGMQQQVEAYIAGNVAFSLPGVQAHGQSMLVLLDDYLQLSSQLGVEVHGLLGYDFFRDFVVKIDYHSNLMTLYEPQAFKPPRYYEHFPLQIEDTKPYIRANMVLAPGQEAQSLKLMVDTGASHALLLHLKDSSAQFSLPAETLYGNLGRGLVGDIWGYVGRIERLKLGKKFAFKQVLTSYPDQTSYRNVSEGNDRDGTMGGEILHRFSVIFDYRNEAFYLSKNRDYRNKFVYSKTGLSLAAFGPGLQSFLVEEVREGSPGAKAGIEAGDIILKVNWVKAKNFTLNSLNEKLRKREGKKIRLVMKRGEEEYKTSFRLRDII